MHYGTTGRMLRVNMGTGESCAQALGEEVLHDYLGGTTLGVKFLYDEVPAATHWAAPDNKIYVGTGPLGGVRFAGSGTVAVIARGALNNGIASTTANGSFGAYLKYSGFDGILVEGASNHWQYLYVHDGIAELRDARHLVGQMTADVERILKNELGLTDKESSVLCIGPAGENLVRFAGLFTDIAHSASHNGIGAVWGSKKLKAIVVSRSAGNIAVAQPDRVRELRQAMIDNFKGFPIYEHGTTRSFTTAWKLGDLPVKNYTTNVFPEGSVFGGEYARSVYETTPHPCLYCPANHHNIMKITEGPFAGYEAKEPEYEQWAAFGPQIGNSDSGSAMVLATECDNLGMDCNEAGWILGWLMECFEEGLLSTKDTDGLEMTWGNTEAARLLLWSIAQRRGIGDLLANGVKEAAEKIGGRCAELWVGTHKPNTPRTHDHRARWVELLDSCVTNSGTLETQPGFILDLTVYGLPEKFDRFSWEEVSEVEAKTKGTLQVADSLAVCAFSTRTNLPLLAEMLNAATGWDFSFDRLFAVGRRSINLQRAYNIRLGHTRSLELPSAKYCSTPIDGPAAGQAIQPHLEDMLHNYYRLMGWDPNTGKPTQETLRQLGLEYVIRDLAST